MSRTARTVWTPVGRLYTPDGVLEPMTPPMGMIPRHCAVLLFDLNANLWQLEAAIELEQRTYKPLRGIGNVHWPLKPVLLRDGTRVLSVRASNRQRPEFSRPDAVAQGAPCRMRVMPAGYSVMGRHGVALKLLAVDMAVDHADA